MNYKTEELKCTSGPITTAVAVGKAVELSWRLSYRPAIGLLPIPVEFQTPKHLPHVTFSQVVTNNVGRPHASLDVKLFPQDAQKAIDIASAILAKFTQAPYNLQVHTTDHTGPSGREAHDLLLSCRPGSGGRLDPGLYSLECVCREVIDPRAFDWAGVLSKEAAGLWEAENKQGLCGRILCLVQMTRPCHRGDHHLHALILKKGNVLWEKMFGWAGFSLACVAPGENVAATATPSRPKPPAAAPTPAVTDDQKWKLLCKTMQSHGHDGWWALTDFLVAVKENKRHGSRFVDGKSRKKTWVLADGRRPVLKKDWMKKASSRGGGDDGILFCTNEFLKAVFVQKYAKKYKP